MTVIVAIAGIAAFICIGFVLEWRMGDVAGWLSGIGSIGAAAVALLIATQDRRDRRDERRAADRAQAKLTMVTTLATRDSDDNTVYAVDVENFGQQPILDVKVRRATFGLQPEAVAITTSVLVNLIPAGQSRSLGKAVQFRSPSTGEVVPKPVQTPTERGVSFTYWPTAESQKIEIWVEFADSFGNSWEKSSDDRLELLPQRASGSHRTRCR